MVDTDVDCNIIREGLIPTRYYEKTTQALSTANDPRLKLKYKLSNIVVCIENICTYIYMTFILVQDSVTDVILVNPFTALSKAFIMDNVGIHTKIKGKEVAFKLEFPKRKTLISSFARASLEKDYSN